MNYPQYFFYRMGILWIFLSIATLSFGQNKTITVNAQNATIKEIFSKIQEQSEYRFFYSDDIIDTNEHLSIVFNGKNINETIEILNSKTNLSYKIVEEKMIVVSKKETKDLNNKVKGRVLSASDQLPLPGVNIVIKGTTTGVISDFDGNYEINIPANSNTTLGFSFIGYKNAEAQIDGKSTINVSLEEDISAIDEVVVTALNISRDKNSLGYSVSVIDGDQLNQAKENNMINTLSGKVAGLQISKAASGVDGSSRVVLRGISSLPGNNRPLVVVDGIPMDAGYGGAGQWGGKDMETLFRTSIPKTSLRLAF